MLAHIFITLYIANTALLQNDLIWGLFLRNISKPMHYNYLEKKWNPFIFGHSVPNV